MLISYKNPYFCSVARILLILCKFKTKDHIKKFKKILFRSIIGLLLLLLFLGVLLSLPSVQSYLGKYVTEQLNKAFGTNIAIEKIAITPFGSVKLGDVLVLDHHHDTLLYVKKLNTSILPNADEILLATSSEFPVVLAKNIAVDIYLFLLIIYFIFL